MIITKTNKPFRILVLAHDARATGGVNNFLRVMKKRLNTRFDILRLPNGKRHGQLNRLEGLSRIGKDYCKFIKLIWQNKFDLIHINPTLDYSSFLREIFFILIAHILSPTSAKILFIRGWQWSAFNTYTNNFVVRKVFCIILNSFDRILVLSTEFQNSLTAVGIRPENIMVVTTMFDGEQIAKIIKETNIECPRNNILFLSRFLAAKGGAELITAFIMIADKYPDTNLIMAGDGPKFQEWRALAQASKISDRILFPGYIIGKAKMHQLCTAEIFVLPTSHPEGMPNAILEAMGSGCSLIVTPVAGIAEIVRNIENGIVIERPDAGLIACALDQLLSNLNISRQIGVTNHAIAWQKWESFNVSNRIGDIYIDAITDRTRQSPNC
jgi:glycosyltransferase involved in cell wall biosynthesis